MIHRPLEEYILTLQIGVESMTFLVTTPDALPLSYKRLVGELKATKLLQIHVTDMSCILHGLIVIVVYSSESTFLAKSPFKFIKIRL